MQPNSTGLIQHRRTAWEINLNGKKKFKAIYAMFVFLGRSIYKDHFHVAYRLKLSTPLVNRVSINLSDHLSDRIF